MLSFDLAKIEDFVSLEEQAEMREIALTYLDDGVLKANLRGPGRVRAKIWSTQYCTPLILSIGDRIVDRFRLAACPVDAQLGWIISLLQPGAQIHPHIDKYPYHEALRTKHLRCNIMVSRDNDSGNPVLGGRVVDVPERTLWGFFPSEIVHCTQVIETSGPRIAFQFGFTVPETYSLVSGK